MTDGSIIHRPPNDIPSPSIHVGYSFIYPPILLSVSLPLLRLKEHTIMISFWNNHAHSTFLTITVSGRLLSSCVPLALTSHSHCPFSSPSASVSPPERPNHFIHPFKSFTPSLMLSHLFRISPQRNVNFQQPTKHFLRYGTQSPSAWFVYDHTRKS